MPNPHVFLSYIDRDREAIEPLRRQLSAAGFDVADGKESGRLDGKIAEAVLFLACFSPNDAGLPEYQRNEWTIAIREMQLLWHDRRWFVPVTIRNCALPSLTITDAVTLTDLGNQVVKVEDARAVSTLLKNIAVANDTSPIAHQNLGNVQSAAEITMVANDGGVNGRVTQVAENVTSDQSATIIGLRKSSNH